MASLYEIHVPEAATPGHCLGTFASMTTAIAIELGGQIDAGMRNEMGNNWLDVQESKRAQQAKEKGRNYKKSKTHFDFSWLARELGMHIDSKCWEFVAPPTQTAASAFDELRQHRNRWFHDHTPHNLDELEQAVNLAITIGNKCGVSFTPTLVEIKSRISQIRSGTYPPKDAPAKEAEVSQPTAPAPEEPRPSFPQQAVGAVWVGEIGQRKLELKTNGALIDSRMVANVASELTSKQKSRYLPLWKNLLGDSWLFVDDLGQVGAYVRGVLRCVGYLGNEAEAADFHQDPFAKFLLRYLYSIGTDGVIEIESGRVLDESNIGRITAATLKRAREVLGEGELMRVTWDGDLISFTDDGPEYLGEIESKDWFPGHFVVPTE